MKKGVIAVLSTLAGMTAGAAAGAGVVGNIQAGHMDKMRKMSDKHLALFQLMNQWVKVKQKGINLSEYFEKKGYQTIAIYGMSYAGETLFEELQNTSVAVAYGIDKNAGSIFTDVDVISPEEELDKVDAIVVTSVTFFDEIEQTLSQKTDCPIISLEDILYDIV